MFPCLFLFLIFLGGGVGGGGQFCFCQKDILSLMLLGYTCDNRGFQFNTQLLEHHAKARESSP